jgi:response regulator RpfG family c-di-GMP phosphodiesterase
MVTKESSAKARVLFVDDEVNILRSIRRSLRGLPLEIDLAESADKALEILRRKPIDVVVSDMRMPTTSGAELLGLVAREFPNTFRIILSGYADVDSMLAAINLGKVHRFLNKPWTNDELVGVIKDGIELSQLRFENAKLLELTKEQNQKLAMINQGLEEKVQLRTKQIRSMLQKLENYTDGLEQSLYNVIASHPNIDGKLARQISESAAKLAKKLKWSTRQQKAVKLSGLVCEIGLIGLPEELIERPFLALSSEQQQAFMNQTVIAALILSPLQELNTEMEIITTQFKSLDCEIPPSEEAKLVAICRDYWRYRAGKITNKALQSNEAYSEMKKHAGVRYDARLLNAFALIKDSNAQQHNEDMVRVANLKPGMILKQDLFNEIHILLLSKGHVFTEKSINKLKSFEQGKASKILLSIEAFDDEASELEV